MGFQTGLSGLNAAAADLDVIGNNVANAGTVGFKSARAEFADVYAASLSGAGASQIGLGTRVASVAQQFTQGNVTATNNPLDLAINGKGFFRVSDATGTVSYTRNGQFHLDNAGYVVTSDYLRLNGYGVDVNGNIIQSSPAPLQISNAQIPPTVTTQFKAGVNFDARATAPVAQTAGVLTGTGGAITFPLTITGANNTLNFTLNGIAGTATIGAAVYANAASLATAVQSAINAVPSIVSAGYSATVTSSANTLTITSNQPGAGSSISITGGSAQAALNLNTSTAVAGSNNFDPTNPTSFNSSTSGTVFDSLGNPHILTLYYIKSALAGGQWAVQGSVDGVLANANLGAGAGNPVNINFDSSGMMTTTMPLGPVALTVGGGATTPLQFALDFTSSTQFGSNFAVNSLFQNGYASGRLTGFNVGDDGVVIGSYTNGQNKSLGQVVLANFANPNGLQPLGQNRWNETSQSGIPVVGTPASGDFGAMQSAAVEESNTDMTAELVKMITAQRVYQANAQTIKTQDAMLQTLVNLR